MSHAAEAATVEAGTPDSGKRHNVWHWIISGALAAVLLYYSLRGVDWGRVWSIILRARWEYLAVGTVMGFMAHFLRSIRWRILLNAEAYLSVGTVFWAMMAGYLGNNFLPARAGELIRTVLISGQSSLSKTYVLTTALSERLMDVIALVLFSSLVLLQVSPKPEWMDKVSRTMAFIAAAGAILIMVLPHTGGFLANLLRRLPLPSGIRNRLLTLTEQVLLGLRAFHNPGRLAWFIVLTIVIWLIDSCGAVITARALGLDISLPVALLLLTGLGLGSALPSTPGYVGIYQFVAVTVLTPFGVARDAALAFIIIMQVIGYILVLALGLPGMYKARAASRTGVAPN